MPELPEVETVRRSLLPLVGRSIHWVALGTFAGVLGSLDPDAFATLVDRRAITGFRRRGKYLFIDLDDGAALVIHFRMTGQLVSMPAAEPPIRFEHLVLGLDDGGSLRFADQRKFGRVIYLPPSAQDPVDARLGPEPLSDALSGSYLHGYTRKRTASIKALLLDQRAIAGLGNIYVDEALWLAQIHPLTPAGLLTEPEAVRLSDAIKAVIAGGIEHRGVTISHFVDGDGAAGENQHHLNAYGRGRRGEPCMRCGTPMQWLTVGGRTSHYCPDCQPAPLRPAKDP